MRRREFLLSGIKVTTSFLAYRALTGSGLCAGGESTPAAAMEVTSPPGIDDSIALLAAYLTVYTPPAGPFPRSGAWTGDYDIIAWQGSTPGTPFWRRNQVLGHCRVQRFSGERPTYALDYGIAFGGFKTALRSHLRCTGAPLPALEEWQTDYAMHPVRNPARLTRLREEGAARSGALEITAGAGRRRLPTDRAVLPQWCIVDALRAPPDAGVLGVEFDLLHDLTSYRPKQRLEPAGTLQANLRGTEHRLHGYLLTGTGSEPTHYWVDAEGRTLLITGGLLASAMASAG